MAKFKNEILKDKLKLKYPGINFRYALFLEVQGYDQEENKNIEYMNWINEYIRQFKSETGKKVNNNQDEFNEFLLKEVNLDAKI